VASVSNFGVDLDGGAELAREQDYVSMLYARLDAVRAGASERLTVSLAEAGGTPQAQYEREHTIRMYRDRVTELGAVETGLCFGRLDLDDGDHAYIGRVGLFGESEDHEALLVDWRAPAARPFYLATAASPEGVVRRRHIRTSKRRVVRLDDEVLDLATARDTGHGDLTGEAVLLAALDAGRTGRMRDVVETIQAEQDRVIRSDLDGVLVVQGGPGTGKTAVALHRAAYLLYTHRRRLTTHGVLVVAPNTTFLRYISEVLPGLAETGVLLATVGDLYPGVTAPGADSAEAAELKGRAEMTQVLAAAVRDRERVPDDVLEVVVDREPLRLDRDTVTRARARARRAPQAHNLARPVFARAIVAELARQVAERIGADPLGGANLLDEADVLDIRDELAEDLAVEEALDWLWPVLTPEELLADLWASEERIASAAPSFTAAQRAALLREPDADWTPADVPLLDELAELLGEDERAAGARAERERLEQLDYAEGVLEIAAGSRSIDSEDEKDIDLEALSVADLIDADQLAGRNEQSEYRTAAERAAADRTWTFGHVVVDEAQELSPMAWRLLMRRCPSRSMTLVGDVAQTGAPGGASSWADVLAPHVGDRWRAEELTVSYRTPTEIMAVAADVLASVDPSLAAPRAVRSAGVQPWAVAEEPGVLAELVRSGAAEVGDGRFGVIVPAGRLDELGQQVTEAVPAAVGADADLEIPVVVLTVRQAKGLEFDAVLVVDPAGIVAESPRGHSDLYVALTRATQRLGVLYPGELPAALTALRDPRAA
jgi:DNA helicase IV